MKLKATNPLVLLVGALAIGLAGCADDVIITEPPPPPPPPDPEAAEISIVSFVDPTSGDELGASQLTSLSGQVGIVINFDTGGFEASALDVLVDSDVVPCQSFSGQAAVGISMDVQTVQCVLDTAEGVGICEGSTLTGRFANGSHTISARLTLQDGSAVTATREDGVGFGNENRIDVVALDVGSRVVGTNDEGWWGGPQDLIWAACPVLFSSSLDVCEIEVTASQAILGGPSGASNTDTQEDPFIYVGSLWDEDGDPLNEDAIEQEDHTVSIGDVFACDGTDITSSLNTADEDERNLDTTAPMCSAAGSAQCEPVIDGADEDVIQFGLYSDGAITLDDVVDGGVGVGLVVLDAWDFADGITDPDLSVQELFAEDVTDIADLPEDDGCGDGGTTNPALQAACLVAGEAGVPVDAYFIVVAEVEDLLGNALGDNPNGTDATIAGQFDNSVEFGVDATAPVITDIAPEGGLVWNMFANAGETFMFEADDPDLASGDNPSGVDDAGCAGGCTAIAVLAINDAATPDTTALTCTEVLAGSPADEFECVVNGPLAVADSLVDDTYRFEISVPDKAVLLPNVADTAVTVTIDTQAPVFGSLNPAPTGTTGTDALVIFLEIGGTVTDASEIADAVINVRVDGADADDPSSLGNGCDAGDYLLSVTGGEIDRNAIDITDGTNAISFLEGYDVARPGDNLTIRYCFEIVASDSATDKAGTNGPNANTDTLFTEVLVTWNP